MKVHKYVMPVLVIVTLLGTVQLAKALVQLGVNVSAIRQPRPYPCKSI